MAFSPSTWPRAASRRARSLSPTDGSSRQAWWLVFGACFLGGLVTHLLFPTGLPGAAALLHEGVVLVGFVALWVAAHSFFERQPVSPLRTMSTLIGAALALVLVVGLVSLTGFSSMEAPTAVGAFQRQVLALIEMSFCFFLLFQLRRLVLYRRTRRSLRNWRIMLVLMSVAALTAFGRSAGHDLGPLQYIPIIVAVAMMVRNSFGLSWIIGLTLQEKMAGAALSLGLLVTVSIALGSVSEAAPGADGNALEMYSYALDVFALQAGIFGILYSLTALLSLVFHLPTTGDVQRKSDETAALHALAHLVDQAFDAERLSASIAAAAVEAGSADAAWLALDGASERLVRGEVATGPQVVAAHRIPARKAEDCVDLEALFEEVHRTQAPLVIHDARSDARVHARAGDALASLLVVPLVTRGAFAGALFATRNVTHGFEQDDVSSIQAFASQAALALDHARLFEEQIEMERLERELAIARTVQERLLPRHLPEVEGLEVAAASTPAREVGGDYYDFALLDDGRLAFIVADVSGKGTKAAFYMAEMQGLFRSLSRLRPDPADFLYHANDALRDILEGGIFISALYGVLDTENGTITLARAGHCPVALSRNDEAPRLLRPDGLGLGLSATPLFKRTLATERLSLRPGDTLALYTDGLVESRSAATDEEYGYDRLLDSLRRHEQQSPEALCDGLLGDLRAFTTRDTYDDDLTLMVLRWCGAPAGDEAPTPTATPTAARPSAAASTTATACRP
jgi:serine phosphatase RsbU (regulator of sigma subunit)